MANHAFGGAWTEQKLDILKRYLTQYALIFEKGKYARRYETWYVDAFAGTGYRSTPKPSGEVKLIGDDNNDEDSELVGLKKGSAALALELSPGFTHHLFIERHKGRSAELAKLASSYPTRDIRIETAEANSFLRQWCRAVDWSRNRAVIFLDPYGMNVEWATIEVIARTKAVDFWLLFPAAIGVGRLLPIASRPPDDWAAVLTKVFGTDEWEQEFYHEAQVDTLFGPDTETIRDAALEKITGFYQNRLASVFEAVAPQPRILSNSKGSALYVLCFAAANKSGAPIAIRIANHILRNF